MHSSKYLYQRYIQKLPFTFFLLFAGLLALILFAMMAHKVLGEQEHFLDTSIFSYLSAQVITPERTAVMEWITFLASQNFLLAAYSALIIFYFFKRKKRLAIEGLLIGLIGHLINFLMKLFFHRARPTNPLVDPLESFSFPSGHATSAFVFYGLLTYLVWQTRLSKIFKRILSALLIFLAIAIGFSRVYLRVHYPSDVAGGFFIGFAWIVFAVWYLEKIKTQLQVNKQKEL
jgi:undecaprenyl-diphosphatase